MNSLLKLTLVATLCSALPATPCAVTVSPLVRALLEHLQRQPQALTAHFLIAQPRFKGAVRRLQGMAKTNFGEIRANLLARDMLPIHLLRCKLAFFGAGKFDPMSSRWVRITLFQGAPLVSDIGQPFADDWNFAVMPQREL